MEIDLELLETLEREILTQEEFETVEEHDQVTNVELVGNSGRFPEKMWYSVTLQNGKDYDIYIK